MMGNLPQERVTPARPFLRTEVDYASPILIWTGKGRGHRAHKGFIAVFVCLSSKAVHLELASDYTAEAFLAAFRCFVSRRGLCHEQGYQIAHAASSGGTICIPTTFAQ